MSTTTVTNRQILKIRDSLKALDGIPGKVGEVIRFDFEVATSWNLSKNITIIERAVEAYERERMKISREMNVSPGQPITIENAANVAEWAGKIETLKDLPQELTGLLKIRRGELFRNGNKIPPGVISGMADLVEE
jgi:hypothetical protein